MKISDYAAITNYAGTDLFLLHDLTANKYKKLTVDGLLSNVPSASILGWSDVKLARDAANTLALRNGTSAQEIRIFRTTDGTNKEYLRIREGGAGAYQIITGAEGTGSHRPMIIGSQGNSATLSFQTQATTRWTVDANGNFIAGADNSYDIGASGATRPRNLYVGTSIIAGADMTIAGGSGYWFSGRGSIRAPSDGVFSLNNAGATDFSRLQFGGTTASFPAIKRSAATLAFRLADDSADCAITCGAITASGVIDGTRHIGGGTAFAVSNQSTNFSTSNNVRNYIVTTTSGTVTATLPTSPITGQQYVLIKAVAANTLTIDGNGKNINGSASVSITGQYSVRTVVYNGTEWFVIASIGV